VSADADKRALYERGVQEDIIRPALAKILEGKTSVEGVRIAHAHIAYVNSLYQPLPPLPPPVGNAAAAGSGSPDFPHRHEMWRHARNMERLFACLLGAAIMGMALVGIAAMWLAQYASWWVTPPLIIVQCMLVRVILELSALCAAAARRQELCAAPDGVGLSEQIAKQFEGERDHEAKRHRLLGSVADLVAVVREQKKSSPKGKGRK